MVATGVQAAEPSAQPRIAIKKKPAPIALSLVPPVHHATVEPGH
jgi:hypothetical protein